MPSAMAGEVECAGWGDRVGLSFLVGVEGISSDNFKTWSVNCKRSESIF